MACLLAIPAGASERDRQSRSFPATPVKPLDIRITVGEIELRGEERNDISVVIEREAPGGPLASILPIVLEDADDSLIVSAVQPDDRKEAAVRSRVVVLAPRATPILRAEVFEGRIVVSGWRGPLNAKVERGPIEGTDLSGILRLETTAGSITLEATDLPSNGLLRLRAYNGDVTVALTRAPANARVLLLTLNGTIASDLPLVERAGFGPRFREGAFGNATPLLSVDTVRGNITLRVPK